MSIPFDIQRPTAIHKLDKKYQEISGIWPLPSANSLAFVQDELIGIYEYDLLSAEVWRSEASLSGDTEDILVIGSTAYILTAGPSPAIFKLSDFKSPDTSIERFALDLDVKYEPEGIAFSEAGDLDISSEGIQKKPRIFQFSPNSKS